MTDEQVLYYIIAFILGYLVSRYMSTINGYNVGAAPEKPCPPTPPPYKAVYNPGGNRDGWYCQDFHDEYNIKCLPPEKGKPPPKCCYHFWEDDTCIDDPLKDDE